MSYRNPLTAIDTKSGEYIRNMNQSLAGTFNKVAAGRKAEWDRRAALNREITNKANKRADKALLTATAEASKNKTIDLSGISEMTDKQYRLSLIDPRQQTQEERLFMSKVDNLGTSVASTISNIASNGISYLKARNIPAGQEGALSKYAGIVGANGKDIGTEAADILFNFKGIQGYKKGKFDESGNMFTEIYSGTPGSGTLLQTISDQDMSSLTNYQEVPKYSGQIKKIGDDIANVLNLGAIEGIAYANQPWKTLEVRGVVKYYKIPDKNLMRDKARIVVQGSTAGLDANDLISYYNNQLDPNGEKIDQRAAWSDVDFLRKDGKIVGYDKTTSVLVNKTSGKQVTIGKGETIDPNTTKVIDKDLFKIQESYLDAVINKNEAINKTKAFGNVNMYAREQARLKALALKQAQGTDPLLAIDNLDFKLISGQAGSSVVALDDLGATIADLGFNISGSFKGTDGRKYKTIKKDVQGLKKQVTTTIYEGTSVADVKRALKFVQTGETQDSSKGEFVYDMNGGLIFVPNQK